MPKCCREFKLLHEVTLYAYRVTEGEERVFFCSKLGKTGFLYLPERKLTVLMHSVFQKAVKLLLEEWKSSSSCSQGLGPQILR